MTKSTDLFTKPPAGKLSPTRSSPPVRELTQKRIRELNQRIAWREVLGTSWRAGK